jgi:ubiquitin carboxyl-terminal hydrolase 4/11/15
MDVREDEQLAQVGHDTPLGLPSRQSVAMHWLTAALDAGALDADAEKAVSEHASVQAASAPEEEQLTLGACIEQFTAEEVLSAEDPWYCRTCKEHQQVSKKFDLWGLPRILVVHLKRFSYKNKYWREKLDNFVDFPVTGLDQSAYVRGPVSAEQPPLYDLFAVSNHYGSLGGGHYTAFARNHATQRWYKFDDSHVAECSPDDVRTTAAYVLYYQRREAPPTPAAPAVPEPSQPPAV